MTQYHFLDESGDLGFDLKKGSSTHFVLAMVQLVERIPLTPLTTVRRTFHFSPQFEFKYHKTTSSHKSAFFESLHSVPFRVRAAVVDKRNLEPGVIKTNGLELFVLLATNLTLRASPLDIADDILVIDGAPPALRRALRIQLSHECTILDRPRHFSKIVSGRSDHEDGLQLADMVAGAIKEYMTIGEDRYYKMFAKKLVDLWQV